MFIITFTRSSGNSLFCAGSILTLSIKTGTLKYAGKIRALLPKRQGFSLNIKLSPKAVVGEEGTRKVMDIIRTWCDLKLWHLQFNIVNRATLEAAQKDPANYRNLIVRVAGYSAYFVELRKESQQSIVDRTEHSRW